MLHEFIFNFHGLILNKVVNLHSILFFSAFLSNNSLFADDSQNVTIKGIQEEMFVLGQKSDIKKIAGSATFIDEESILEFATTDLNSLLSSAPGVYIRQEDGFGLRPNINIRGTSSDRSSKITFLEDSILIGPAPYSAPAAYYIPNVSRTSAVEVFKGPSVVKYGPHTVGGAINFVTPSVDIEREAKLGVTVGEFGFHKIDGAYGDYVGDLGYRLDFLSYGSDGFKELDDGGDTGFIRNDVNAKFLWDVDIGDITHEFVLKLGYAEEDADETYLGLTEDDFAENPFRRYRASDLDRFQSEHKQIHLIHSAELNNSLRLTSRAYYNSFDRSWNKFDGIINGPTTTTDFFRNSINVIFANPDIFASEIQLLRGERDSNLQSDERIDITNNDRSFTSSGLQLELDYDFEIGDWQHKLSTGLLFHSDYVERNHSQRGYFITGGELIFDGIEDRIPKALNRGETDAFAFFAHNTASKGKWDFSFGGRFEHIESSFEERASGSERELDDSYSVFTPGVGAIYNFNEEWSALAGVNRGFSPKAASAEADVENEETTNYELGLRYFGETDTFQAIAFYSDYSNLLGRCRASDPCSGEEFNGGSVEVEGLELHAQTAFELTDNLSFPIEFIYTYTDSRFTSSFESNFAQWTSFVEEGDELPYLPGHQGRLQFGLDYFDFSASLAIKYVDKMREVAEQVDIEDAPFLEALTTIDLSLHYMINSNFRVSFIGENIADEIEVVSRRPFGARPNQPRTFKVGVSYEY